MAVCDRCGGEADWAKVDRVPPSWLTRRERRRPPRPPHRGTRYCMDCVALAIERTQTAEEEN